MKCQLLGLFVSLLIKIINIILKYIMGIAILGNRKKYIICGVNKFKKEKLKYILLKKRV
jgi:hypothetical protein